MIARRRLLQAGIASLVLASSRKKSSALGRIPGSGRLRFALPWPLERLDPHDLFDPVAALFAHAVCDPLFALDAAGEPYPTLAAEPPVAEGGKTIVRLRPGIVSARGRPLSARDVVFSIDRSRRAGGRGVWADLPPPAAHAKDALAVVFATNEAGRIARALACPLLALVPRGFAADRPDGTGALRADFAPARLLLARNPRAARGASFLEEVVVDQAADLSASLRALEGDTADLGWLGGSLHTRRPGAISFDAGAMGWIVLLGGSEAGAWSAPGAIQRLVEDLPAERFQHLGLGPAGPPRNTQAQWGGSPCDLYFEQGAAQLEELARILSSLVSRPGHEVTPRPLAAAELARRRASGSFSLALGVVRPVGPPGLSALIALTSASDPAAAVGVMKSPPRLPSFAPNLLARTLRLGVLGELRATGARAPDVVLAKNADGWDLASSYRTSPGRS